MRRTSWSIVSSSFDLVLEDAEHLGPELSPGLLFVGSPDDHAFAAHQVGHDAVGQREEPLAAHAGHSVKPRSLASLARTSENSRR